MPERASARLVRCINASEPSSAASRTSQLDGSTSKFNPKPTSDNLRGNSRSPLIVSGRRLMSGMRARQQGRGPRCHPGARRATESAERTTRILDESPNSPFRRRYYDRTNRPKSCKNPVKIAILGLPQSLCVTGQRLIGTKTANIIDLLDFWWIPIWN
jgi:hypothetical protein